MATRIQHRRGTAAQWAAANPVLADGEIGFERDTRIFKIGDGVTVWNDLSAYILAEDADDRFLLKTGKAADSLKLEGRTWNQYQTTGTAGTVNQHPNIAYLDGLGTASLNRHWATGEYNIVNHLDVPPGIGPNWLYMRVMAHISGTSWQHQTVIGMNSRNGERWTRFCSGSDPTVAGNWTRWEPEGNQPRVQVAQIFRDTSYAGPAASRYQIPMTHGDPDDGIRMLYRDGDNLRMRRSGWFEFTAHNHSHSVEAGPQRVEIRVIFAAGGERALNQVMHTGNVVGGSVPVSTGPVLLSAGDVVNLVMQSPNGTTYVDNGIGATLRGRYLGPN